MPIEIVTVTIPGSGGNANGPLTQQVSVPVTIDPATNLGSGTGSFSFLGSVSGVDNVQAAATMAGTAFTSDVAQINWQSSNGQIQVGSVVTAYMWNDSPTSGSVAKYTKFNPADTVAFAASSTGGIAYLSMSGAAYQGSVTGNSLVFDPSGSAFGTPVAWQNLNSSGTPGSPESIFPGTTENFNMVIAGFLLVPPSAVGIPQTLTLNYKDSSNWGIGGAGASWAGKGTIVGVSGQTMTAMNGYPLLPSTLISGSGGVVGTSSVQVTFAAAGIYPIEGNWDYWYHSGRTFSITANGQVIAPVTLQSASPVITPTGNLTLTNSGSATTGGAPALLVQGQTANLSIHISGVLYTSVPYLPILEGVAAEVFLYNSPTASTFTFPATFDGVAITPAAALNAGALSLSGSGSAGVWNGLLSMIYDTTAAQFALRYNGSPFNLGGQSSTTLTVTVDDIAWYSAKGADVFQDTSQGGGVATEIQINYLTKPTLGSLSPSSLASDGQPHLFTLALSKALTPVQTQNAVTLTITPPAGVTCDTPVPTYDALTGWLSGYTFHATCTSSLSSATSANFTFALAGSSVTYLHADNTIGTDSTLTYFNTTAPITLLATTAPTSNPTEYSWSVGSADDSGGSTVTLSATVQAASNTFGTCQFLTTGVYAPNSYSPSFYVLGSASPSNIRQIGALWYADYSLSQYMSGMGTETGRTLQAQFGFTETQTDGGIVTYHDTNNYY